MIFTPTFMGSEPCHVRQGRLAGTEVLVPEERAGLDMIRSLDDTQLATAVLRPSIEPHALPSTAGLAPLKSDPHGPTADRVSFMCTRPPAPPSLLRSRDRRAIT